MRINTNISAMNAHRQLGINNNNGARSMERLSSGLRINRAGDDAAGLAISEKMRAQVRGLNQASRNAQDGISLIQTAEGALDESHSILQRMRELATQAANDTNVGVDREEIQKEMNQLTSELNRIGNTTEFNTQKLLNGGGIDPTRTTGISSNGLDIPAAGFVSGSSKGDGTNDIELADTAITTVNMTHEMDTYQMTFKIEGQEFTFKFESSDDDNTAVSSTRDGNTFTLTGAGTGAEAADVMAELDNLISNLLTELDLDSHYSVSNDGTDTVTVTAEAVALDGDDNLVGRLDGGKVTSYSATLATVNTVAEGSHASVHLDFSNATVESLTDSELMIGSYRIAFFDSGEGKYEGTADHAVDLNGALNTEEIIDKLVDYFAIADNTLNVAAGDDDYTTDLLFSKADDNTLQITAETAGADGNRIALGNLAEVDVINEWGTNRLEGEGVVSARGLDDGIHTVWLEHQGTDIAVGDSDLAATVVFDIAVADRDQEALSAGNYRLLETDTANEVDIQRQNGDGTWTTITDAAVSIAGSGDKTFAIGGESVTINFSEYTDGNFGTTETLTVEFTVNERVFASLEEAGSDSIGTEVRVYSGQTNVSLNPADGTGPAVVNIGSWNSDNFEYGDEISWRFETEAAQQTEALESGEFSFTLQIGANTAQSMTVSIDDMRAQALTVSGVESEGTVTARNGVVAYYVETMEITDGTTNDGIEYALDVSSHEKATAAISVINDAIETVSAERSKMGAAQNRLEHTIGNLGTSAENLQAAESRIRDLDMAAEMMEFTKNNILNQAATAMLAQANMAPQTVLQLLG